MRWSRAFLPTLRDTPKEAEAVSHQLMLRAGLIRQLGSGAYSYLPLGLRVLSRVIAIIREEMNRTGAQECLLPAIHPLELWRSTGRDAVMREVLFHITDRQGRELVLGPTHEEVITDLVKGLLVSYKQLPVILYQIQTKFRDEPRPRSGVLRTKEFLMKDAYSFHRSTEDLARTYEQMRQAYVAIFDRCGLSTLQCEADPGAMGGSGSMEFLAPAVCGEDVALTCACGDAASGGAATSAPTCPRCRTPLTSHPAIEVGHIFQLGAKYSEALSACFQDERGTSTPLVMGCYGIGVNRILATAIEQHHDEHGIIWPPALSPWDVLVAVLEMSDAASREQGDRLYDRLTSQGMSVLYDDRELGAGPKFYDADLLGIPLRVIVGKRNAHAGQVELNLRNTKQPEVLQEADLAQQLQKFLDKTPTMR